MSLHKSVEKRLKQSKIKRLKNRQRKSTMHTSLKKAIDAIKLNQQNIIKHAIKIIAKTASKGVIHKRNASNKISKIMLQNFKVNRV